MAKIKLNIDKSFFNEAYLPILNNKERITVLYGGGGSGKSHFVVQKMIIKAFTYPNRRILIVRKVQRTIRNSIYKLFLEQLEGMGLLKHCNHTTTNLEIRLPNGSEIIFTGLDDPEKIKSITRIDDIVIEEASELSNEEEFMQLNTRLRSKAPNQQIHCMFNPVSKSNWVYKYWFKQEQPNTRILHTTYKDNLNHLPQEYIDQMESYKEINPFYYDVYTLGKFGNLGKRVFTRWQEKDFDVTQVIKENPKVMTRIGADWGFSNDPTTIIYSLADIENRKLWICEETYQKGLLNNEIAEIIHLKGYQKQEIIADSAEPKTIEEMKQHGISNIKGVKKGKGSILTGIQFMQQFEIFIHPSCENTIREFGDYSYRKDKHGEYINEFEGADHALDAIRYSLTPLIKPKKVSSLRVFDKSLLGL